LPTADKQLDFLVTPDEGNFWPPLSDYNNDCPWPADLTIESCPVGSATE
jgi:hypothetical protein